MKLQLKIIINLIFLFSKILHPQITVVHAKDNSGGDSDDDESDATDEELLEKKQVIKFKMNQNNNITSKFQINIVTEFPAENPKLYDTATITLFETYLIDNNVMECRLEYTGGAEIAIDFIEGNDFQKRFEYYEDKNSLVHFITVQIELFAYNMMKHYRVCHLLLKGRTLRFLELEVQPNHLDFVPFIELHTIEDPNGNLASDTLYVGNKIQCIGPPYYIRDSNFRLHIYKVEFLLANPIRIIASKKGIFSVQHWLSDHYLIVECLWEGILMKENDKGEIIEYQAQEYSNRRIYKITENEKTSITQLYLLLVIFIIFSALTVFAYYITLKKTTIERYMNPSNREKASHQVKSLIGQLQDILVNPKQYRNPFEKMQKVVNDLQFSVASAVIALSRNDFMTFLSDNCTKRDVMLALKNTCIDVQEYKSTVAADKKMVDNLPVTTTPGMGPPGLSKDSTDPKGGGREDGVDTPKVDGTATGMENNNVLASETTL